MERHKPLVTKKPLRSGKGFVPRPAEQGKRRKRLNAVGKGAIRNQPQYEAAKELLWKRLGGRYAKCEWCDQPHYLDPHHAFGRSHLVPREVAYLPEALVGLCREHHDMADLQIGMRRELQSTALTRIADRYGVSLISFDATWTPLQILREIIRNGRVTVTVV